MNLLGAERRREAMKVALQTVIFGHRMIDLEQALDVTAAAGFQGVEVAQLPSVLGDAKDFLGALSRRNLTLVGLSGGAIADRIAFWGRADSVRPYLDLDTWEDGDFQAASAAGFTVALHQHYFKGV